MPSRNSTSRHDDRPANPPADTLTTRDPDRYSCRSELMFTNMPSLTVTSPTPDRSNTSTLHAPQGVVSADALTLNNGLSAKYSACSDDSVANDDGGTAVNPQCCSASCCNDDRPENVCDVNDPPIGFHDTSSTRSDTNPDNSPSASDDNEFLYKYSSCSVVNPTNKPPGNDDSPFRDNDTVFTLDKPCNADGSTDDNNGQPYTYSSCSDDSPRNAWLDNAVSRVLPYTDNTTS